MSNVRQALDQVIEEAVKLTPKGYFEVSHDPEWPSDCIIETQFDNDLWKPAPQLKPVDFSGLANALGAPIHKDIQDYYGSFWSGSLQGKTKEGPIDLIQLWNQEDFERLIANLIGHMLEKQRSKSPFTIFFATTDPDSELFLSIENDTGRILLEEPGKAPIKEVDTDIASFLKRITAVKHGKPGTN